MMMSLTAACASIDAPPDGCEWVRPITLAEGDVLRQETKRALLTHNEAWSEFCKKGDLGQIQRFRAVRQIFEALGRPYNRKGWCLDTPCTSSHRVTMMNYMWIAGW